jgi:hypothetical protein
VPEPDETHGKKALPQADPVPRVLQHTALTDSGGLVAFRNAALEEYDTESAWEVSSQIAAEGGDRRASATRS